jgi:polar amino acid transport system substrate-binding protein
MNRAILLLPLALLAGCAGVDRSAGVSPAVRSELAPTGKLRVGLIAANPVFVTPNTPPGVTRGLAVDIAAELAKRIDVPMEPLRYPTVGALVESAGRDEWDIAFLAIDPERAEAMNFTAAYMFTENTFLVPAGSTARALEDLDRPGKTIATFARSAQEIWLKKNARSATLVSASSPAAAYQMLREGKVDAVTSTGSLLAEGAKQVAGARVLPTSYSDTPIGLAVAKRRPAAYAYAYEFIEDMKKSGAMREAVARAGLIGVRAAEPLR